MTAAASGPITPKCSTSASSPSSQPAASSQSGIPAEVRRWSPSNKGCSLGSRTRRHGLPRPGNLRVAREAERAVREAGAIPATIAALGGRAALTELAQAERLEFDLTRDLGYRFPDYPLPPTETPISHLRQVTWNGARARYRPLTARAQAQLERELDLIEKLDLAGYFLIVWDIVRF